MTLSCITLSLHQLLNVCRQIIDLEVEFVYLELEFMESAFEPILLLLPPPSLSMLCLGPIGLLPKEKLCFPVSGDRWSLSFDFLLPWSISNHWLMRRNGDRKRGVIGIEGFIGVEPISGEFEAHPYLSSPSSVSPSAGRPSDRTLYAPPPAASSRLSFISLRPHPPPLLQVDHLVNPVRSSAVSFSVTNGYSVPLPSPFSNPSPRKFEM